MNELFGWGLIITTVCAWFTHLFACFAENLWGMLIVGAVIFPIGIIHGIWLWFQ
jgi:hypothetical protein